MKRIPSTVVLFITDGGIVIKKNCQQLDGGPNLKVTVRPNPNLEEVAAWRGLNIKLHDGYFWCSCENESWKCTNVPDYILGPTYGLKTDKIGMEYDNNGDYYGWIGKKGE